MLQRLCFDGPLSRFELGPATGLSSGSVSNVVADLVADGPVEEAGSVDSDGGRPRTLLRVAPGSGHMIGVDVGETRVRVELFDLTLTELARAERPLSPQRYEVEAIVDHIRHGIAEVLDTSGLAPERLLGVGIGVPGIVERTATARSCTGRPSAGTPSRWRPCSAPVPRCPTPSRTSSTTAPRRWAGPRCGSAPGAGPATPSWCSSAPASARASSPRTWSRAARSNGGI